MKRRKSDVHLSLVVADNRRAMVLDDSSESGGRPAAASHPAWELVVPDAVVSCGPPLSKTKIWDIRGVHTTEKHAVGLGEVSDLVATAEREGSLRGLGGILDRRA